MVYILLCWKTLNNGVDWVISMNSRYLPLMVTLMVAGLAAGFVISEVIKSNQIQATVILTSEYLEVYDETGTTLLSEANFGTLKPGETSVVVVTVKNIHSETVDVAWSKQDLPTGTLLTAEYNRVGTYNPWNENDYGVDMLSTGATMKVRFTLSYNSANDGTWGFTLVLSAK